MKNFAIKGSAKARLDEKGRIAMPVLLRDKLLQASGLVLTCHPHGCLSLYEETRFNALAKSIAAAGNVGYMEAHLEELVIGCAEPATLDAAGRLLAPRHLRERAQIRRSVLLFGVGDSLRLWDEERWEKRHLLFLSKLQDAEMTEEWKSLRI